MRNLVSWMLALMLSSTLAAATAKRPGKALTFQQRLQTHVAVFEGTRSSPIQVLIRTAIKCQLPFALEYVDRDAMRVQPQLKLPAATAQSRIELLVGMMPGFKVSFSDGLVDVYALAARSDPSNLLNVVLPHFKVQGEDAGIASSEAFEALLAQERPGTGLVGSFAGVGGERVTIDAHYVRVYEILNMIVSEQGHSMWVVGAPPDKLSKLDGNLWHFYTLYPDVQPTVVERLLNLFPKR